MIVSKGKGSHIKITYSEALYDSNGQKGNRNHIKGKMINGYHDLFICDGGENRRFESLWNRTWRYIQLNIQTKDEPLIIEDFHGYFSAYPLKRNASFSSDQKILEQIMDIGWRTARLCAGETYFDCPYYEQLNYVGDTRIQALISLYMSGDDRLMRKAIKDFHDSKIPDGLTQSRYPSNSRQIIPPYSLYWIKMIHDFYMHVDDPFFARQYLPGIQSILSWFETQIDSNNLVSLNQWWNFIDWTKHFKRGIPHGGHEGYSSIINLQYVDAMQSAAYLFQQFGQEETSSHYKALSDKIGQAVINQCFDDQRGLIAQTPEKKIFSQHANVMAVLTNTIDPDQQKNIMQKIIKEDQLIKCSIYYKFYLFRALKKTGLGCYYINQLSEWEKMIDKGLSTFSEKLDNPRSDCHAWSASPCYQIFSVLAGISPDSPGFKKVRIEPSLCSLKEMNASIPHPHGTIELDIKKKDQGGIEGFVKLPPDTPGQIIWEEEIIPLKGGEKYQISLP